MTVQVAGLLFMQERRKGPKSYDPGMFMKLARGLDRVIHWSPR